MKSEEGVDVDKTVKVRLRLRRMNADEERDRQQCWAAPTVRKYKADTTVAPIAAKTYVKTWLIERKGRRGAKGAAAKKRACFDRSAGTWRKNAALNKAVLLLLCDNNADGGQLPVIPSCLEYPRVLLVDGRVRTPSPKKACVSHLPQKMFALVTTVSPGTPVSMYFQRAPLPRQEQRHKIYTNVPN